MTYWELFAVLRVSPRAPSQIYMVFSVYHPRNLFHSRSGVSLQFFWLHDDVWAPVGGHRLQLRFHSLRDF